MSQTEMMNARMITLNNGLKLVETSPQRWFLGDQARTYIEVKRTESDIYLTPSSAMAQSAGPMLFDLADKKTYYGHKKERNPGAPTWWDAKSMSMTSGYSVSRIRMAWDSTPVALDLDGTDNVGWKLTTYKADGETVLSSTLLQATQVARSPDAVTVTQGSTVLVVDLATRRCTVSGANCYVVKIFPVSGLEVGHIKFGKLNSNNEWVGLVGLTQTAQKVWREETATGPRDWSEDSRGPDFLRLRDPNGWYWTFPMYAGDSITAVNSPTSTNRVSTGFSVAHMQRQWPGQLGTVFQPVSPGVSPGFQIQNKTDYPVLVTLEQVGCLYYGIVKPGEVFQRDTGAVWFTIKASMAPDLKEPTVESCIRKPAMYAATIAVAGFTVAGTAGMGTALVVPAMLATAAGQGAAITTQQYLLANGATQTGALGARVGVTTLTDGAKVLGLALAAGGTPLSAVNAVVTSTVLNAVGGGALVGIQEVRTRLATQPDIDSIQGQLTQEARVFGAYAGYPWPWKMVDRVMPRYDITGGPRVRTMADGTTILLKQESPLTITKVN
jgi:hypothetical protein